MKLYLARHGDYAFDAVAGHGCLTQQGEVEISRVAAFIKPMQLSVSHIFHSGKHRAKQTAELLSHGFQCEEAPQMRAGLNPDDDVAVFAEALADEEKDELFVGHLPFMAKLTSYLLAGNENKEIAGFATGTLLCLSQIDRSRWTIDWLLTPSLLR